MRGGFGGPRWPPGAPTERQPSNGSRRCWDRPVRAPCWSQQGHLEQGSGAAWPPHPCPCRPADGSSLPSHVSHNAGVLSFHKVSRSDSGNYTCIASNSPQGEIRATVQLVVAGEGSPATCPAPSCHLGGTSLQGQTSGLSPSSSP